MDFTIPEELKQLQNLAREFIKRELLPLEKEVEERDEFPEDIRRPLRQKAIKLGLWNYAAPQEYGGGGVGALGDVLVYEELGKVSMAVGTHGLFRSVGGRGEGAKEATDEQREKYIIPVIKGEKETFFALTEPNAGSDAGAIETRAIREREHYVLNGTKTFITNADRADFGYVFAVTDWEKRRQGGISCFLVEKGTSGFSIDRRIPVMGRRGVGSYEISFTDCIIPVGQLLGEEGKGGEIFGPFLSRNRLLISSRACGTAQRALDMAVDYARGRITFGKPIIERQFVQGMLTDTFMDIFATRMMNYNLAWRLDQGFKDLDGEIALIKATATEMSFRAVDRAIQIHGGVGYSKDLPLEMMLREIRIHRIGEGPTEVLKWFAARRLFRKR